MSGCLNFSKLKVNQLILGIIKTVNDFDITVSLPNQLTGFVSCDRISEALTEQFRNASETTSIPSLKNVYKAGELVVAAIVGIETPQGGKRRRLELSLEVDKVNNGSKESNLVAASVLAAQVISHEDRGYTMSIGIAEKSSIMAFLPDSETLPNLVVGKSVPVMVSGKFDCRSDRVVMVTQKLGRGRGKETVIKGKADFQSVRVGTLVRAEVVGEIEGGRKLLVNFAGHQGKIDILGLPEEFGLRRLKDVELSENFPIGKQFEARICHVDVEEKHFLLTCLSRIVDFSDAAPVEAKRMGEKVEVATVYRVDPSLGVLIHLDAAEGEVKEGCPMVSHNFAYVHISRLSDERIEKLGGQFRCGTKHAARLIDYDAFSGLYQGSLQPSILKESILRIEDVKVGQIVRGTIAKMESFGVIVNLTDRIKALCPTNQLTEVSSEQALKSVHMGQRYKFRVLDVEVATRRITLTRKRGLVDTNLPLLTAYEGAVVGNIHEGFIAAIEKFGCIVRFFGGVKGIITVAEMSDEYLDNPQENFFVGQVIKCKIVKCVPEKKELVLSVRKSTGPKVRTTNSDDVMMENKSRVKRNRTLDERIANK